MGHLREGRELDVSVEPVTLAVDAVDVPAVHARPDGMPKAGVVLHPDVGGLRPLFDDMARRLATHGLAVCAVEPFAGIAEQDRATTEERLARVADLDDEFQLEMLSGAADLLVVEDGVTRVGVLGFCMGGHYAFKAAAGDRFDAAVAFYGMLRTPESWRGPATRSSRSRSRHGCARRSRSSDRPIRGPRPPTSTRCAPHGVNGPTARSKSSTTPITASCTTRSGRCTAPTEAAACWDRAISWLIG